MTEEPRSQEPPVPPAGGRPTGRRPARRPGRIPRAATTPARQSLLERYRTLLIGGVGALALVAVGIFVATSAAQPAYACGQEWTASGAGSPDRIGYVQSDLGKNHVAVGQKVTYPLCPPASGNHYSASNVGPIKAQVYGPNDPQLPQGWLHNLEHGGMAILYRCPGELCDPAGQARLQKAFLEMPDSPVCKFPPTQPLAGVVITRFDEMQYPVVALLWGQILPLESLDAEQISAFYLKHAERTNPEVNCPRPTATPAPTTESPAASPSGSPGAG